MKIYFFNQLIFFKKLRSFLIRLFQNSSFNKIGSEKYWAKRYEDGGNSGDGSYGDLADFKATIINTFVENKEIHTTIELGCGDGNQLSLYKFKDYHGVDVYEPLINQLKLRFPGYSFSTWSNKLLERKWELSTSIDVLYHVVDDNQYNQYMNRLFNLSSKWVLIYSSNFDSCQHLHVKHRNFSGWVDRNRKDFYLYKFIKNKYPNRSSADFFIYKKI